jgi:hypothetical protein
MNRFLELEKEVNKGISVDEKSNTIINNWSPNNVKRLIVGYDYAIVQYFKTGAKYPRLVEIVDLRRQAERDMEQVAKEPQNYKSVLAVLTKGRICSSIEEIVFCDTGYPPMLLLLDSDYSKLVTSNASLENRFVRLRHISIASLSIRDFGNSLLKCDVLLDGLKEDGVPLKTLVSLHEDDWWKGTSLRPKYYSMDSEVLLRHFNSVKDKMELKSREEKLDWISAKKHAEVIKKYLPITIHVLKYVSDIFDKANGVFDSVPVLSKAEWANVLQYKNMCKGIRKELLSNQTAITSYRRIDFDKIVTEARKNEVSEDDIKYILSLRAIVFSDILNNEEEYKLDSNKHSMIESLQMFQKLTGTIFNHQINIVFLSFAKYLTRNTPEYVNFFFEMLNGSVTNLSYTRSIMEYCNNNLEPNWAKSAMVAINATELVADQYTVIMKSMDAQKILFSLATSK